MQLGRRDRVHFPSHYQGFRLIRTHGRVFGIPPAADPEAVLYTEELFNHPAVISAGTLDELCRMIDQFDEHTIQPETIGHHEDYRLVRLRGSVYAVPDSSPAGDLNLPDERRRLGVIEGCSVSEVKTAIDRARVATPVEFAGWLPAYEFAGNCGHHPQFKHTGAPPEGYRFTCSAPAPVRHAPWWEPLRVKFIQRIVGLVGLLVALVRVFAAFLRPRRGVSLRARLRVFSSMLRLTGTLLYQGCRPIAILKFLQTRHLQSQLLLGNHPTPVFLTSMPFTFGQVPWLIEIEDPTTLFFPQIQNGSTSYRDLGTSPTFPIVKTLLESAQCKAILTHMRSTARMVQTLFASDEISRKVVYAPLGV